MQYSNCSTILTENNGEIKGKILQDNSSTGKERPWKARKKQTHILADAYFWAGDHKKAVRIEECGTYLEMAECPQGHEKRLKYANFCRERLCPMCQWRRSMKLAWQVNTICHLALQEKPKLRFLMLNLSARNVPGDELEDEISNLLYSFRKLKARAEVDRVLEGYFRAIEVTYNSKKDTYHPHFHCILAVKPSYFTTNYIKQSRWTELWKQSLKVDYTPQTWVKAIKSRSGKSKLEEDRKQYNDDMARAVAETGKYSVKPDDYIQEDIESTSEVIETLSEALKGRRLISYAGILKEMYQKLNMDDIEDSDVDLIHTTGEDEGCKCSVCGSNLIDFIYNWFSSFGEYIGRVKEKGL